MADFLDRASPPHILTLVIATSVSALATNVFLPSLPGIARHFEADYALAQLTVSIYLAATAVLQLGIGPASDRFGRRPVMLVCLGIFTLGSLAAILAPTIELLLAARILQAFSAAGMVLARAIVRDTVASDQAASRIGYITMGMAMVPMVAPMIGGLLDEIYDWRASFVMMIVFGLVAFLLVFLDLGETNRNASASLAAQMRAYPGLIRSLPFWGYALTGAFCMAMFFVLVGAGPFVATELLGLRPSEYGLYFGMLSLGYMIGNFLSGRYSRRVGLDTMMLNGNVMAVVGTALAFGLFWFGLGNALALFGPMVIVGIGNGMTLPNAAAGVVSVRPELAGSASGLAGSLQLGFAALVSASAGIVVTVETGVLALLALMLVAGFAAILVSLPLAYRKSG
ncbi:MAG: multidrug effflux MFS transporter [Aquamicrobium sp.]|uniref:multidrug effflux MFS transporter n=1 Tax=Aquamicrobium sp. TaxID=1872579 RepID=UPI00349E8E38|nr:multidrug effflux MFS transporter [Aquamicrobium sp.]